VAPGICIGVRFIDGEQQKPLGRRDVHHVGYQKEKMLILSHIDGLPKMKGVCGKYVKGGSGREHIEGR